MLLNDVPVFHENLLEIQCALIVGIVGSNKPQNLFCLFCFVAKSINAVSELNLSKY